MLSVEQDVLVLQWAAIAAENYVTVPEVFKAAAAIISDPAADLDVRYSCLAAVRQLGPSDRAIALLEPLASDPQLGVSVRRILTETRRTAEP